MAKKKELSTADKHYIEQKHFELDDKQLSKDVNVILSVVRKFVDTLPKEVDIPEDKPESEDPGPQGNVNDLMAKNEKYGVTVMTPAASQMGDATRHHRIGKSKKMESMIHQCKPPKK